MENTSAILFDNKDAKYFLALAAKAIGPLTTQEVYEKLTSGQCQLVSYLWREGWNDWRPMAQDPEFQSLLPKKPSKDAIAKIQQRLTEKRKKTAQKSVTTHNTERQWYLFMNETQFGPFSKEELIHALEVEKAGASAFVWMAGWPQWKPLTSVPEFSQILPPPVPLSKAISPQKENTKSKKLDRRGGPRKPMVARLFLAGEKEVIVAVCRDISVGGMQILTDHVPGTVGSTVKLNVSPVDGKKVEGFVAEGVIVRVLEDGRGFSFRFTKISDQACKAIENYIKNAA